MDIESLIMDYLGKESIPPMRRIYLEMNACLKDGLAVFDLQVPDDYHQRASLMVQALFSSSDLTIEVWEGIREDGQKLASITAYATQTRIHKGVGQI